MPDSLERLASILNGLLIVCASILGAFETTRILGISVAVFMGAGLIFSGWANFCGWYRILGPCGANQCGQTSFRIEGRAAHVKGPKKHCESQVDESQNLPNGSS